MVGQSVGTGPTSWLAKQLSINKPPLKSVVLISPFSSAVSVVSSSLADISYTSHAVSESTLDIFDTYYHLQSVTCRVQIISGTADQITPYSHALKLQGISKNGYLTTLNGAGHNDVWDSMNIQKVLSGIRASM